DGHFLDTLARRVAYRTESQRDGSRPDLVAYLEDELAPALTAMGFSWRLVDDGESATPFVIAERIEDPALTTVLSYGRGTADNKGQHSVNLAALEQVLAARGRLGFNAKFVIETGEELGSPGLRALCERERGALAA